MRRNLRLPGWLDIVLRGVKYLLLAFFVCSIAIMMSPTALQSFIQSDYHKLADVRLMYFFLHISPTALSIITILMAASIVLRNPFCRFLCPYGALLGLASLLSPLRVSRDSERCVSCGACNQVCPSTIDVMHKTSVATPECIGCWRCINHCRFNEALTMRAAGRIKVSGVVFAALVVLLFWGGSQLGKATGHWQSAITVEDYVRLLGTYVNERK
jgi:polyferredoxin